MRFAGTAPPGGTLRLYVDQRHAGTASGLNSAVARTGGLIATALLGAVLVSDGEALIAPFHTALLVGAIVSIAAGAAAWLTVDGAAAPTRKAAKA